MHNVNTINVIEFINTNTLPFKGLSKWPTEHPQIFDFYAVRNPKRLLGLLAGFGLFLSPFEPICAQSRPQASVCAKPQTPAVVVTPSDKPKLIGRSAEVLELKNQRGFPNDEQCALFTAGAKDILNFDLSDSQFWIRFQLANPTDHPEKYYVDIGNPLIDTLEYWILEGGVPIEHGLMGDRMPHSARPLSYNSFVLPVRIDPRASRTLYLRIRSNDQLLLPIHVGGFEAISAAKTDREVLFGMYIGLMLVMFVYNGFIYFTTRDRSYLSYILYILSLLGAQMLLEGFAFQRVIPNFPRGNNFGPILLSSLTGLTAIAFARQFLSMPQTAPRLSRGLRVFEFLYVAAVVVRAAGYDMASFRIIDIAGLGSSLYGIVFSSYLAIKGHRPARFYGVAWILFIVGIVIYVGKNFGLFAYNDFTNSAIQLGSSAEVILLSFALGDRINQLRKDRESAWEEALKMLEENERIVREQNVILEEKVEQRTHELSEANVQLNQAMVELKEAQSQLVDSEKMASLGQLTAGIAHEINNPINFVSSNVNPLKRDLNDLIELIGMYERLEAQAPSHDESALQALVEVRRFKKEIDYEFLVSEIYGLIDGIKNGADRTGEIVRGLRTFSRLDEDEFKEADIEDGLLSTLTISNNKMRDRIELVTDFCHLPQIPCYPGKLNQVFMNIIINGIQAIEERLRAEPEHEGRLLIRTQLHSDQVEVEIVDNGTGMDEEVRNRMFEPFFTTKPVGEGTGLGLSIVYKIIQAHAGSMIVESEVGKGSRFKIFLPRKQTS